MPTEITSEVDIKKLNSHYVYFSIGVIVISQLNHIGNHIGLDGYVLVTSFFAFIFRFYECNNNNKYIYLYNNNKDHLDMDNISGNRGN